MEVLERGLHCFDRERHHPGREVDAARGRDGPQGAERRGEGGSVREVELVTLSRLGLSRAEEVEHREDLSRCDQPVRRHRRQGTVEHRGDPGDPVGMQGAVSVEMTHHYREHHRPGHRLGESAVTEGESEEGNPAAAAACHAFVRRLAALRARAVAAGEPVDVAPGVRAHEVLESAMGRRHPGAGAPADAKAFPARRDAPQGVQVERVSFLDDDAHAGSMGGRWRTPVQPHPFDVAG